METDIWSGVYNLTTMETRIKWATARRPACESYPLLWEKQQQERISQVPYPVGKSPRNNRRPRGPTQEERRPEQEEQQEERRGQPATADIWRIPRAFSSAHAAESDFELWGYMYGLLLSRPLCPLYVIYEPTTAEIRMWVTQCVFYTHRHGGQIVRYTPIL